MAALAKALVLAVVTSAGCLAGTFSFQGIFSSDDQVDLFQFTLSTTSTVTIQSYGYAGGMIGSTVIPSGGFAPDFTLFVPLGADYVQANSDNGGHCGITQTDPVTGNCDDPFLQTTLPGGTYFLALSVWDNVPLTGFLADGFKQTGNPGFSCQEGGLSGQFCDVTDALFRARTGDFAISLSNVDTATNASVPEPSSYWLVLTAGLWGGLSRRRRLT